MTKNPAYRRHWISQPMRIEAGDVQTGAPTYKNFKEHEFELLYVDFDQGNEIFEKLLLARINWVFDTGLDVLQAAFCNLPMFLFGIVLI